MKRVFSTLVIAGALFATVADAGSIGRSGGGGFSGGGRSSASVSRPAPSFSQPSKPAVAPAPATAHPGGIGGTNASVGVRKSEVTSGVKQDITGSKSSSTYSSGGSSYTPHYTPTPSYSYSPPPQPVVSSGFGSSFMGSLTGTMIGNALFGNHGHSGTTVINNGTPGATGAVVSNSPGVISGTDAQFNPGGVNVQPKKEYGVWSFIADVIGFVFLLAVLVGLAWVVYKGFQMVRNYVNKERGVSNIPFYPTQKFWEIQKAFAAADVNALQNLLGPDIVDELTQNLQPSTLTLQNVSHEVRLANNTEFSIWYKFEDDGAEVNQVWHYEKFGGGLWKLNGIENV